MSIELQGNIHESELGADKETLGGYCGRANTIEELCGFGARLRRTVQKAAAGQPAKQGPRGIKGALARARKAAQTQAAGWAMPKFPRMAAGAPKPKKGMFSRFRRSVAEESSGG